MTGAFMLLIDSGGYSVLRYWPDERTGAVDRFRARRGAAPNQRGSVVKTAGV